MIKICFVCSGNTCRSVMAERLLKKLLKDRKISDVKVCSKGLYAAGENIAENAKVVLKQHKALATNRKSIKLKKPDKETVYVVMTENMKEQIASKKVITMKSLGGKDIIDPYGQDVDVYKQTAEEIIIALENLINIIKKWREV